MISFKTYLKRQETESPDYYCLVVFPPLPEKYIVDLLYFLVLNIRNGEIYRCFNEFKNVYLLFWTTVLLILYCK